MAATLLGLLMALAGTASSAVYVWSAAAALGAVDRSAVLGNAGYLVFGILLTGSGLALLLMLTSELRGGQAVLPRRAVRRLTWLLAGAGGLAAVAGLALAVWHVVGV